LCSLKNCSESHTHHKIASSAKADTMHATTKAVHIQQTLMLFISLTASIEASLYLTEAIHQSIETTDSNGDCTRSFLVCLWYVARRKKES